METAKINNLFIEDVIDNLRTIAKCESIMNDNKLISSDMEIDINAFTEGMSNGLTEYYFAIRQHGSMSHYNAEALKDIINKKWDETYIAIKVERCDSESDIYLMTINRK
jgi:hypothetical protein